MNFFPYVNRIIFHFILLCLLINPLSSNKLEAKDQSSLEYIVNQSSPKNDYLFIISSLRNKERATNEANRLIQLGVSTAEVYWSKKFCYVVSVGSYDKKDYSHYKIKQRAINLKIATQSSFLSSKNRYIEKIFPNPYNIHESQLLTLKVYDNEYNTKYLRKSVQTKNMRSSDELLGKKLFCHSLQSLVKRKILQDTKEMEGFALPIGIYKSNNDSIDFKRGLINMWNNKKTKVKRIKKSLRKRKQQAIKKLSDYFIKKYSSNNDSKTNLRKYREKEMTYAVDVVKKFYLKRKKIYGSEQKEFMKMFINTFSQNILLSYNIHELLPPSYNNEQINPVFKAYFFDRLLQEAGTIFIEGYPAMYDYKISFGPFQLTDIGLKELHSKQCNKFLNKNNYIPEKMSQFRSIQTHCNAAALFAYINWEMLSQVLMNKKLLKEFNHTIKNIDERRLKIFIAGITACMHHLPTPTRNHVRQYFAKIKQNPNMLSNIHFVFRRFALKNPKTDGYSQLQKYYDSAAELYLILKVYHILDDRFSINK